MSVVTYSLSIIFVIATAVIVFFYVHGPISLLKSRKSTARPQTILPIHSGPSFEGITTSAPTTAPATTAPATTRPATTKPVTTRPATTRPATTKPVTTAPATTAPATTVPATTAPATTAPATTVPATTAPATTAPTTAPNRCAATTAPATTAPSTTQSSDIPLTSSFCKTNITNCPSFRASILEDSSQLSVIYNYNYKDNMEIWNNLRSKFKSGDKLVTESNEYIGTFNNWNANFINSGQIFANIDNYQPKTIKKCNYDGYGYICTVYNASYTPSTGETPSTGGATGPASKAYENYLNAMNKIVQICVSTNNDTGENVDMSTQYEGEYIPQNRKMIGTTIVQAFGVDFGLDLHGVERFIGKFIVPTPPQSWEVSYWAFWPATQDGPYNPIQQPVVTTWGGGPSRQWQSVPYNIGLPRDCDVRQNCNTYYTCGYPRPPTSWPSNIPYMCPYYSQNNWSHYCTGSNCSRGPDTYNGSYPSPWLKSIAGITPIPYNSSAGTIQEFTLESVSQCDHKCSWSNNTCVSQTATSSIPHSSGNQCTACQCCSQTTKSGCNRLKIPSIMEKFYKSKSKNSTVTTEPYYYNKQGWKTINMDVNKNTYFYYNAFGGGSLAIWSSEIRSFEANKHPYWKSSYGPADPFFIWYDIEFGNGEEYSVTNSPDYGTAYNFYKTFDKNDVTTDKLIGKGSTIVFVNPLYVKNSSMDSLKWKNSENTKTQTQYIQIPDNFMKIMRPFITKLECSKL